MTADDTPVVGILTLIQKQEVRALLLEGLFVLLLALALGHAGPYGTYEKFALLPRIGFWVLIIMLPWCISKFFFLLIRRFAPAETSTTLINVLLMPLLALVGSAAVTAINLQVGLYAEQIFIQVWPSSILVWLIFAFCIILPMMLIASALAREHRKSGVTNMMEFFHYKLPDSLQGGQLIALKAEDHYLRVITDIGSALILMKLEDALAALNGYPGIQTHRSWWIASSQLKDSPEVLSSSPYITLQDGSKVPVSRRKRKAVNAHIMGAE